MTLSVKVRFEVLKRDRFTCSYCGKHPPEVLLEVDHIVPRAAGGSDEIANLTTACTDCNRGKGGRMLEEGVSPGVNASALAEMQERIEQAKAYMELLGSLESLIDEQVWRVNKAWGEAYRAEAVEAEDGTVTLQFKQYGRWPDDRSIKRFIKKLGLEAVIDAVDITASRLYSPNMDAVRYFYGVCHRWIREGREPLSQQPSEDVVSRAEYDAAIDTWFDGGEDFGRQQEHLRLGEILKRWSEHGYSSLEDAVLGLWPED